MRSLYIIFSMLFMLSMNANAQLPDELTGSWTLQVKDSKHQVVTTLKVHFIEENAQSCLGGNWKKVIVESYQTTDPDFFPENLSLSYEFDGNHLSIGRNEICDAYLQLSGQLNDSSVTGEYIKFGWGSEKLGYFSLQRDMMQ